jgi:hypothetical protein
MDSQDRHHRLLTAFLTGELNPADVPRWDQHLLECEPCWRAVREDRAGRQAAQVLCQVVFAVELAAAGDMPQRRPRHGMRLHWRWLASAGALACAVSVAVAVLLPGGRETGSMPAAVAAVARYAEAVPPAPHHGAHSGGLAAPVEVGHPVTVTAGGQQMVLRVWRLGHMEAVVAVSAQPFPMPARAHSVTGPSMARTAQLANIGLDCRNGHTSELVAAPVPEAQLAALAAWLPT